MQALQGEVLVILQNSIESSRTSLNSSILAAQAKLSESLTDNANLQTLQKTIKPEADALTHRELKSISDCIEVQNGIATLNTQIQRLVGN